jgi:hypothetical protein
LDLSKVKSKENKELMHMVGRRLREAADAEGTLPEAMRRCLEALQATESRNATEMSPFQVRTNQARRQTPGRRSDD